MMMEHGKLNVCREMPSSRLGCQKETQLLNGIDKTREGEIEENYESKRPLLLKLLQARQFGTPDAILLSNLKLLSPFL